MGEMLAVLEKRLTDSESSCPERYYEMTGHPRDDDYSFAFLEYMSDGSRHKAAAMWDDLLKHSKPIQEELQLKNPKVAPVDLEGEPIEYWVLTSAQPEVGSDGKIRYVTQ